MTERENTIVCTFDPQSPRITAYDIHEWIYETMHLEGTDVAMVQVDGPRRQVYIKFKEYRRMQETLMSTNGQGELRHSNGVISKVRIEAAGLGIRRVRIANLPPEISDRAIKMGLSKFGEIKEIQEETWSRAYRYSVANGIRIVVISLTQHIPSHVILAGYRTLISYEGQPTTCYGCNGTGHLYQDCPRRRRERNEPNNTNKTSWADVASGREGIALDPPGDMEVEAAAAEMATLETRKNEDDNNASPREEHPSVPGNHQSTAEVQQVRRDKRDSTEKGVVLTQVMEQDVEEVREKSGEDVTIQRAKEVRQRPTTLTMDAEDKQTEEMQILEHDGDSPERGRGWRGSEHRHAEDDATPPAQATSPKRSKKLKTDRHGDNPPERRRSRTRTITTKTQ
jgi:hypothetical protein